MKLYAAYNYAHLLHPSYRNLRSCAPQQIS
uniref:tRNA pseudouridine synthase n=1 Tax=Rhizophora mucronata TaxID=61149 RepID=A0A2P2LQK2_RHIMU